MIPRSEQLYISALLKQFPAVAILGPRQIGKTTLALSIANTIKPSPIYLDLERPSDLAKLQEPEIYLKAQTGRLVIIDEVQRTPGLFQTLRSVIDERRQQGDKHGQFLLLGSASLELLHQSAESLAGRIVYRELSGLTISEVIQANHFTVDQLWLRGGFPESLLAENDALSFEWRWAFINTYLERDIPQLGPRIPAETLRRLWTMLAHLQGTLLNASKLAASLSVSVTTVNRYLDLLVDLLLVRYLRPWSSNHNKRLVKTPKIYVRDSGLTHALLNIKTLDDLFSHPVVGNSWENFVIENIISVLPKHVTTWFYRTSAGAEIDLLIEANPKLRIAIEIKRSLSPTISKGFHFACEDVKATHQYIVYAGKESYPLSKDMTAISLIELTEKLKSLL